MKSNQIASLKKMKHLNLQTVDRRARIQMKRRKRRAIAIAQMQEMAKRNQLPKMAEASNETETLPLEEDIRAQIVSSLPNPFLELSTEQENE